MTCTKFKLTTVAALVLAATNANAALYDVVEVKTSITGASEIFGVAIQPATVSGTESCFTTGTVGGIACDSFKLAGETRDTLEAVSYREEVPFAMDAPFQYIQEFDDFENYCYRELRYSTCESWAQNRWNDTWSKERNDLTYVNARAFVEGGETFESRNTVINSLDDDAKPVGVKSEGGIRNNALFTTTAAPTGTSETRAWKAITANSTVYNVGSVSVEQVPTDTSEPDKAFSSKAAIWDGTTTKEIDWVRGGNAQQGDYFAQGSMRSIAIDESNSIFYGVGYNTVDGNGDLQDMNASVFVSNSLDISGATWTTKVISGAEVKSGSSNDDAIYSNSVATDINDNLFAVGYSKRNGYVPESGSAGNKIFVVTDAKNPTATYLSGGIFFGGSSGEAKAVNNFNEFVGQIDAETTREVDGSERRHRGFIYPYQATGTDASRIALFESKAWWLDDLTNDDDASGENNKFRIIDATDINDAGVISATAIKCTVGGTTQPYDTTSHNSYCGGAASNAVEEVVAVKLVPIAGATKDDIQTRSADTEKVDRQGGSLGWLTLTVLALLGFRRKFK
ncbi:GlyGly-CTERM sorting domain-containing protein [Vibrio splendidus]|nr:GlyGly-CTERM sorting domain-containing protein [Vibrio splendidus]